MYVHMCVCFRKNVESKEDLAALVEESSMPLQDLLSRYGGAPAAAASDDSNHLNI